MPMTELKNRGIQDILVACVDGLNGFPDAIASVYPHTDIQLCIVLSFATAFDSLAGKTIRLLQQV